MDYEVKISEMKTLFCAERSPAVDKWGTYCLPTMNRTVDGDLLIRVNGHGDNELPDQDCPDIFFLSRDNAKTWHQINQNNDEKEGNRGSIFSDRFVVLPNGNMHTIARDQSRIKPLENAEPIKKFENINHDAVLSIFRLSDLPDSCIAFDFISVVDGTVTRQPMTIEDEQLEVIIPSEGADHDKNIYVPIPLYWKYRPMYSLCKAPSGCWLAVCAGQIPDVKDYLCTGAYLLESADGIHWKRRSIITERHDSMLPFGVDEFCEFSIAFADNGTLICVMRTDKCMDLETSPTCGTLCCVSYDEGLTWTAPVEIADSSTTPVLTKLPNGLIVFTYGRPGVHMMITEDGEHWSRIYPILGKTLKENLAEGRDFLDCKFYHTISYSNIYPVVTGENSLSLCTTYQVYAEGEDIPTKNTVIFDVTVDRKANHSDFS